MVSMLGAMLLVNLAVFVGFVLLFVPGTLLMVSFMFAVYAIGVEDERAIDSLSRQTRQSRWTVEIESKTSAPSTPSRGAGSWPPATAGGCSASRSS
jgi:hypothetical protein